MNDLQYVEALKRFYKYLFSCCRLWHQTKQRTYFTAGVFVSLESWLCQHFHWKPIFQGFVIELYKTFLQPQTWHTHARVWADHQLGQEGIPAGLGFCASHVLLEHISFAESNLYWPRLKTSDLNHWYIHIWRFLLMFLTARKFSEKIHLEERLHFQFSQILASLFVWKDAISMENAMWKWP